MRLILITVIALNLTVVIFNLFFNNFNIFKTKYNKMHFDQVMLRELKSINFFDGEYKELLIGSSIVADIDENHKLFSDPFNYTLAGTSLEEIAYHLSLFDFKKRGF